MIMGLVIIIIGLPQWFFGYFSIMPIGFATINQGVVPVSLFLLPLSLSNTLFWVGVGLITIGAVFTVTGLGFHYSEGKEDKEYFLGYVIAFGSYYGLLGGIIVSIVTTSLVARFVSYLTGLHYYIPFVIAGPFILLQCCSFLIGIWASRRIRGLSVWGKNPREGSAPHRKPLRTARILFVCGLFSMFAVVDSVIYFFSAYTLFRHHYFEK